MAFHRRRKELRTAQKRRRKGIKHKMRSHVRSRRTKGR